jgi:hypothetical protein
MRPRQACRVSSSMSDDTQGVHGSQNTVIGGVMLTRLAWTTGSPFSAVRVGAGGASSHFLPALFCDNPKSWRNQLRVILKEDVPRPAKIRWWGFECPRSFRARLGLGRKSNLTIRRSPRPSAALLRSDSRRKNERSLHRATSVHCLRFKDFNIDNLQPDQARALYMTNNFFDRPSKKRRPDFEIRLDQALAAWKAKGK